MTNVTIRIPTDKILSNIDLGWVYRLINMKISELEGTRPGPHVQRETDELRSLSQKVWALEAAINERFSK